MRREFFLACASGWCARACRFPEAYRASATSKLARRVSVAVSVERAIRANHLHHLFIISWSCFDALQQSTHQEAHCGRDGAVSNHAPRGKRRRLQATMGLSTIEARRRRAFGGILEESNGFQGGPSFPNRRSSTPRDSECENTSCAIAVTTSDWTEARIPVVPTVVATPA